MLGRATDKASEQPDFVIRRRLPPIFVLSLIFIGCFAILLLAGSRIESFGGAPAFAAVLAVVLGGLGWFTISFTQRNRDIVLATEFQNALFAGAAGINTRFCLISHADGGVTYSNPGFQKMFDAPARSGHILLDLLLDHGHVTKDDATLVRATLAEGKSCRVPFYYTSKDGGTRESLWLTVDPLPRPSGYALIRGLNREQEAAPAKVGDSGNPVLENLINTLPFGLYTLSNDGRISFTNETLDLLLGYGHGDIARVQMPLSVIVEGRMADRLLKDPSFSGEVTFRKRDGGTLALMLSQQAMRGPAGEILGFKGITQDPSTQKKSV
ncbi:MAG: PAS domain-containing protein [Alphaproteobacteria bacterium]|nr:PAS domain-containing protein [Alphaproteobacteria bacterium]